MFTGHGKAFHQRGHALHGAIVFRHGAFMLNGCILPVAVRTEGVSRLRDAVGLACMSS